MLYFVFTIDGDWEEYFRLDLPEERRRPDKKKLIALVEKEIAVSQVIDHKFLHFVHTSPRARDFFLLPEFIRLWQQIEEKGGSVGVHCHEDDPRRAYFSGDLERMKKSIFALADGLRKNGLSPQAYRGGYMAFNPGLLPILEENGLFLDFSCEPGRHLTHNGILVSDWRGSPEVNHRLSEKNRVFEIPLGKGFYLERASILAILAAARRWKKRADEAKKDIVLSVLAHAYDFGSAAGRAKIKIALSILKRYGRFINAEEALDINSG